MKIVLVATKSITVEKFLVPFLNVCSINNDELVILCNGANNLKFLKSLNKNIDLYDINFPDKWSQILNPIFMIFVIFRIRKIFNTHGDFIFYTHTPVASHLIRMSSFFKKNKVIYHVHGFRFHDKGTASKNFISKIIEIFLSKCTHKYITINKDDFNFVKNKIKKKVDLINGVGIDTKKLFNISSNKKTKIDNKIIIGIVGAYKIEKGYDDIINLINDKYFEINIEFHCYGYGNNNLFKSKVRVKNNSKVKIFFHNFSNDILNIMNGFDLLIHPSRREGLPVSVMEAMCLNIPIIATNIRGCRDLINDNVDGKLYNPFRVNELFEILNDFTNNRDKYIKYAQVAQAKCMKLYDASHKANEIYLSLKDNDESKV